MDAVDPDAPVDGLARRFAARRVAEVLRTGSCPADRAFDRFLPDELRVVSGKYWTPLNLYNPFGEYRFGSDDHLDEDMGLRAERYARDVAAVENLLQHARVGTCVLTYNGFGGRVPGRYQQIRIDHGMPNVLRLWQKKRS